MTGKLSATMTAAALVSRAAAAYFWLATKVISAGPAEITFVANQKYAAAARLTKAAAVIVAESFPVIPAATLRVEDPYHSFARALELFHQPLRYAAGVHPTAIVHPTAKIAH